MKKIYLLFTVLIFNTALAEEIDFSASLGIELRGFIQSTDSVNQANGIVPSFIFEPEVKWRSDDRKNRFSFVGSMFAGVS